MRVMRGVRRSRWWRGGRSVHVCACCELLLAAAATTISLLPLTAAWPAAALPTPCGGGSVGGRGGGAERRGCVGIVANAAGNGLGLVYLPAAAQSVGCCAMRLLLLLLLCFVHSCCRRPLPLSIQASSPLLSPLISAAASFPPPPAQERGQKGKKQH